MVSRGKIFYPIAFIVTLSFAIWDRMDSNFNFFQNLLFLTMISLHMNLVYLKLSIMKEFRLLKLDDWYFDRFFNFNFSITFFICVMFWGMHFNDPKALIIDGVSIPLVLNLFIHGGTFVVNLIDKILIKKRNNKNIIHWISYVIFTGWYLILAELIYHVVGYEIYPFLAVAGIIEVSVIFLIANALSLIGHFTYRLLTKVDEQCDELIEEKETELESKV